MNIETAFRLLSAVPGGVTEDRLRKLTQPVMVNTCIGPTPFCVPESATLTVCGDEKTGVRFGNAKCRRGRCLKIGSGGRNKGSSVAPYQVWAVWE